MTAKVSALSAAILMMSGLALGANPGFSPVTRVPPIHVFCGGFDTAALVETVVEAYAEAPFDILWMRPFATYNFRCGPIRGMGGAEVLAKTREESIKRLSAVEVAERASTLSAWMDRIRATGVRHVAPYTCLHSMAGDHEKRLAFWEFYDHWDEYRHIGLCEKPSSDPFEWNQQKPDGSPRYLYPHKSHLFWPPAYRYAASCAHPDRLRWMEFLVQDMCRLGVNGVFVDNATGLRDFGPYARKSFGEWIRSRYTATQIQELFDGTPIMSEEAGTLATYETRMCWNALIKDYLRRVRRAGESIHEPYFIMPNGGRRLGVYVEFAFPDCDQVMYEGEKSVPGLNPSKTIVGPFKQRSCEDNAFIYAHTFGVGARARAFPFLLQHHMGNRNISVLWHAEAGAFGGGGSTCSSSQKGDLKAIHEVMNLYRNHYTSRRSIYEGKRTLPVAAVANFGSQWFYDNYTHSQRTRIIFDTMLEQHVLTDVLTMPGCFQENLARYKLIVVPFLTYLSDEHLAAFMEFKQNGGELLIYGDSGAYDQTMRKRPDNPFAALADAEDFSTDTLERKLTQCAARVWPVIEPKGMENEWEGGSVKAAAYMDDPGDPAQLVLHIVNFNVYLGRNTDRVLRGPSVEVQLPLPRGTTAGSASVLRVDDGREESVAVTVKDSKGQFTLKDVGIHTVCVVDLSSRGG